MEKTSKESKRGNIQSFFSSQTTKKKRCDASLIFRTNRFSLLLLLQTLWYWN